MTLVALYFNLNSFAREYDKYERKQAAETPNQSTGTRVDSKNGGQINTRGGIKDRKE